MKVKRNGFVYLSLILYLAAALLILIYGMEEFYYAHQYPYLFRTAVIGGFFLVYGILNILFYVLTRPFVLKLFSYLQRYQWVFEAVLVIAVLAGGIWIRIYYINSYPVAMESDYKFYYDTAIMIKDGTLTTLSNNEYISLFPHTYGYSYILSLAMRLFGTGKSVCLFLNVAFSMLTSLFCYGIVKKIAGSFGGILALILATYWPSQIIFSNINGAEAAFTCFLYGAGLLAIFLLEMDLVSKMRTSSMVLLHILCGVILGLSSAIRPMGLILLIAILICLLSVNRKIGRQDVNQLTFRKIFLYKGYLRAVIVLLAYIICSQTVSANVSRAIEKDIASGGAVGYSLMVGLDIKSDGGYSEESMNILYKAYEDTLSAKKANDICMDRATRGVLENPMGTLELMAKKFFLVWSNDHYATTTNIVTMNNQGLLSSKREALFYHLGDINQIFYLFVVFLSAIGVLFMMRKKSNGSLYAILFVGTVALFLLVEMQNRYHYFALPGLAILAACGIGFTFKSYLAKSQDVIIEERAKESIIPEKETSGESVVDIVETKATTEAVYTMDVKKAIEEGHISITATPAYKNETDIDE